MSRRALAAILLGMLLAASCGRSGVARRLRPQELRNLASVIIIDDAMGAYKTSNTVNDPESVGRLATRLSAAAFVAGDWRALDPGPGSYLLLLRMADGTEFYLSYWPGERSPNLRDLGLREWWTAEGLDEILQPLLPEPPGPREHPPPADPPPDAAVGESEALPPVGAAIPWSAVPAGARDMLLDRGQPSPDGRWIAARVSPGNGMMPQVWLAAADRSTARLLEPDVSMHGAELWSPQGAFLYWRDLDDSWQAADPATGEIRPLLPEALQGQMAMVLGFSADGSRLLYSTGLCYCNRPPYWQLRTFVIHADGSGRELVGVDVDARWDGNEVVAAPMPPAFGGIRYDALATEETAAGLVQILPRPAQIQMHARAAASVQVRAYPADATQPVTVLNAREVSSGEWLVEWPDPPAQPVRVQLYLEVREGVPDQPRLVQADGTRWTVVPVGWARGE